MQLLSSQTLFINSQIQSIVSKEDRLREVTGNTIKVKEISEAFIHLGLIAEQHFKGNLHLSNF